MECVSKKMLQSSDPVTKTGNYGDNATPTPTTYSDDVYTASTVSFTAESGDDPAYLSDSAYGFADNHIQSNWSIEIETIGTELITDGEFELWTSGVLDNWDSTVTANRSTVKEVTGGVSSKSCVQLTVGSYEGTSGTGDGHMNQSPITVTAEESYTLRGYYRNASGSTALYRLHDNSNAERIDAGVTTYEFHRLDDSEVWTSFSYEFDAPAGCTSVMISLGAEEIGDVVYFDNISLAKSGTNDGTYTIADRGVSRGTILLDEDDSLTTENAATAGEVTISKIIYQPNVTTGCPFCGSLNSRG